MATDPKEAQAKLKQLQSKLPKSAPQQFQKDYTSFLRSADKLMSDIDDAAKVSTKKDREDYERKKRDADAAKKKVNDAVAKQQGQAQKVQGDVSRLLDATKPLMDALKNSNDKNASALSKAVRDFAVAANQQAQGMQDEAPLSC